MNERKRPNRKKRPSKKIRRKRGDEDWRQKKENNSTQRNEINKRGVRIDAMSTSIDTDHKKIGEREEKETTRPCDV